MIHLLMRAIAADEVARVRQQVAERRDATERSFLRSLSWTDKQMSAYHDRIAGIAKRAAK